MKAENSAHGGAHLLGEPATGSNGAALERAGGVLVLAGMSPLRPN